MLIQEIILTCSHAAVAEAALASMGGSFAAQFETRADALGIEAGALAADAVRRFAKKARGHELSLLRDAITGHDQPVLAGLRHILEASLLVQDDKAKRNHKIAAKTPSAFSASRPARFCDLSCAAL